MIAARKTVRDRRDAGPLGLITQADYRAKLQAVATTPPPHVYSAAMLHDFVPYLRRDVVARAFKSGKILLLVTPPCHINDHYHTYIYAPETGAVTWLGSGAVDKLHSVNSPYIRLLPDRDAAQQAAYHARQHWQLLDRSAIDHVVAGRLLATGPGVASPCLFRYWLMVMTHPARLFESQPGVRPSTLLEYDITSYHFDDAGGGELELAVDWPRRHQFDGCWHCGCWIDYGSQCCYGCRRTAREDLFGVVTSPSRGQNYPVALPPTVMAEVLARTGHSFAAVDLAGIELSAMIDRAASRIAFELELTRLRRINNLPDLLREEVRDRLDSAETWQSPGPQRLQFMPKPIRLDRAIEVD